MIAVVESSSAPARSRLWLVPMLAALCYPLFLSSTYGSMQVYGSARTGLDHFGAAFMCVASLAAAFGVPLVAALSAGRIAHSSPSSPEAVRAYRLAHLAFAAPPLFTAFGVFGRIVATGTGMPGIEALDYPAWIALWLGLGFYCVLPHPRKPRTEARSPGRRLVGFHGLLALSVLLLLVVTGLTLARRHTEVVAVFRAGV